MKAKPASHPLAIRFSVEERRFLNDFQQQLAQTMPNATLSDAVKVLVEAGRKALRPPTPDPERFLNVLRALDPTWNGLKPEFREPPGYELTAVPGPVSRALTRRKKV